MKNHADRKHMEDLGNWSTLSLSSKIWIRFGNVQSSQLIDKMKFASRFSSQSCFLDLFYRFCFLCCILTSFLCRHIIFDIFFYSFFVKRRANVLFLLSNSANLDWSSCLKYRRHGYIGSRVIHTIHWIISFRLKRIQN